MPEFRARQHHRDRVAETLRDEISSMMAGELADPRIGSAFVTEVVLAPGGKSARVFIAVDTQDQAEWEATLEGLVAARGYIRYELRKRMGVRHVPELSFHLDKSEGIQGRIGQLLDRAERSNKKIAARNAANPKGSE